MTELWVRGQNWVLPMIVSVLGGLTERRERALQTENRAVWVALIALLALALVLATAVALYCIYRGQRLEWWYRSGQWVRIQCG